MGDKCDNCQKEKPLNFRVPNKLWRAVTGIVGGYLCLECFIAKAIEEGLYIPGETGIKIKFYNVCKK